MNGEAHRSRELVRKLPIALSLKFSDLNFGLHHSHLEVLLICMVKEGLGLPDSLVLKQALNFISSQALFCYDDVSDSSIRSGEQLA